MNPTIIQTAAEELTRDLHLSSQAIPRISQHLTKHLADVALGQPDNGLADQFRQDLATHQRILQELPAVITELHIREAELIQHQVLVDQDEAKKLNDQKFFELLDQIVTAGQATPAEITALCQYAGRSSNPARRCDMDRLIEALEDHDRHVRAARAHHQEPPVFGFKLEEDGGR
ncbi:MAG: hypothetical protein FIA89_04750 [Geobacter sp.]|nr:hypothetical protein [Geobacter sp.]